MTHLHLHTEYSIRDSLVKIENLIDHLKENNIGSIAITDHGNLSGSMEFYLKCEENNIKPIIGMEVYIVPNIMIKEKEKRFHLVLIAKNEIGYKNLIKLASIGGIDGFYYVPRLDLKTIAKYKEGLIALTACAYNSVIYMAGEEKVRLMINLLQRIFSDQLYLEIMLHNIDQQKKHNFLLQEISHEKKIQMVVTQDIHYLEKEDKEAHDILMKIQGREPYEVENLSLIDQDYIIKSFQKDHQYILSDDLNSALENTKTISNQVECYNIPLYSFEYPIFRRIK